MKLLIGLLILLLFIPISTADELEIQPHVLDTYFLYTGMETEQTSEYRFISNRQIESCVSVEGVCRIDQGYILFVDYEFDTKTKVVNDVITVIDIEGNTASVNVIIKIISVNPLAVLKILLVLFIGLALLKYNSNNVKKR